MGTAGTTASCLILFMVGWSAATYQEQVLTIVDTFWNIVPKQDGAVVTDVELVEFFTRYGGTNGTLDVRYTDFSGGNTSWRTDMGTDDSATWSCFRLLDVYHWPLDNIERITFDDALRQIILADTNGDGSLTEAEFKSGYQNILRGMQFGAMMDNFIFYVGTGQYNGDVLFLEDFDELFFQIDTNYDFFIDENETEAFYVNGGYGDAASGRRWFQGMAADLLTADRIDWWDDWPVYFVLLDTLVDNMLDFEEFQHFDTLAHP